MPDHKARMKVDNFEKELSELLSQTTDEMMQDISQQLSETEEKMKKVEKEMQEKNITEEQLEKTQPLQNLLSETQKKHFSQTIKELGEMSYNPQQWNDDRLRQEKVDRVESLISMLNLSLDDYTETLQGQIKFTKREHLVTERKLENHLVNISTIERAKCEQDLLIYLNVTYNSEQINVTLPMPKGVCALEVAYLATDLENADHIDLQVFIGDNTTFDWRIQKEDRNSLLASFYITIDNLDADGLNQYSKRSRIDLGNNQLRFSVYIPI